MRLVAATNRDLGELLREDFSYRLNVIGISLPPPCGRREDIRRLVRHDWPGNVRELRNAVQRFLATDNVSLPGAAAAGEAVRSPGSGPCTGPSSSSSAR